MGTHTFGEYRHGRGGDIVHLDSELGASLFSVGAAAILEIDIDHVCRGYGPAEVVRRDVRVL